jgi:thioredoxin 1
MPKALKINDDQFQNIVLSSAQPVLVDFWGEGCPPCESIAPIIDELASDYEGRARVVKINTSQNPQFAGQYGITSVPNILFFKNGEIVDQQMGMVPKELYAEKLDKLLQS